MQDDIVVRVYEDAAVVTYRITEKGKYRGEDYNSRFRYTDTWAQKGDRWRLVAVHWSKIAGK